MPEKSRIEIIVINLLSIPNITLLFYMNNKIQKKIPTLYVENTPQPGDRVKRAIRAGPSSFSFCLHSLFKFMSAIPKIA